jgi:hypothetical protein
MKGASIWRLSAAVAIAVAATTTFATNASAQPVETGSLAFTSDPGDWVGHGGSYSYSTTAGDEFNVTSGNGNNIVDVSVLGDNGDGWLLTLAAPPGQALEPGQYSVVRWYPGNSGPGLRLSGNIGACYLQSGSFTIENITFGPFGYVQALDATYEQYCDGNEAGLRGEVHIANPAPPPVLELGAAIGPEGAVSRLNGSATVHGTLSCTKPVTVDATVRVIQVVKRVVIQGYGYVRLSCTPDQPAAWTARVDPFGTTPYQKGEAEVSVSAWATDPTYNVQIDTQQVGQVRLDKPPSA